MIKRKFHQKRNGEFHLPKEEKPVEPVIELAPVVEQVKISNLTPEDLERAIQEYSRQRQQEAYREIENHPPLQWGQWNHNDTIRFRYGYSTTDSVTWNTGSENPKTFIPEFSELNPANLMVTNQDPINSLQPSVVSVTYTRDIKNDDFSTPMRLVRNVEEQIGHMLVEYQDGTIKEFLR